MGETIHEVKMVKGFWLWSFWAMVIGFLGMAVFIPDQQISDRLVLTAMAVFMLLLVPDMKAIYGTEGIVLTFGVKGIWKKRIPRDEVTYISIVEFRPLRDFGGWGIKGGHGEFKGVLMWAMPTKKARGIMVETVSGRKYLLGDEEPDETLTFISSAYPVEPRSGRRSQEIK